MKLFEIWSIYTILDTQTYEQTLKTDLKSSRAFFAWNLKNRRIIFEKCAFFIGHWMLHKRVRKCCQNIIFWKTIKVWRIKEDICAQYMQMSMSIFMFPFPSVPPPMALFLYLSASVSPSAFPPLFIVFFLFTSMFPYCLSSYIFPLCLSSAFLHRWASLTRNLIS